MTDVLDKALENAVKYRVIARAHYLAADSCSRNNKWFGIPVIIITAMVGTSIFGSLEQNPDHKWRILAGIISITGTVLAVLQTSLGFAQTAEKHKAAGEEYRSIQRKFEMLELKYRGSGQDKRVPAMGELSELVGKLDGLPQAFPSVPDRCFEKAKEETKQKLEAEGNGSRRTFELLLR